MEICFHGFGLGSMVINNFNRVRIAVFPGEADAPLIIYSDAVLPGPFTFQGFQAIGGRHTHILQSFSAVELQQFAKRGALDVRGQPRDPLLSQICFVSLHQKLWITPSIYNVMRYSARNLGLNLHWRLGLV
jgi:hypothetical protein